MIRRAWMRRRRNVSQPVFDAATTAGLVQAGLWTHIVGSGGGTILVALASTSAHVANPTCGGVAMTKIGQYDNLSLYTAPATAGAKVITAGFTAIPDNAIGMAVSYKGVTAIGPPASGGGTSAAMSSGPVWCTPTDLVVSALWTRNPPLVTTGTTRAAVTSGSGTNTGRILEATGYYQATNVATQLSGKWSMITVRLSP